MNILDGVLLLAGLLALGVGWRLGLVCGLMSILAIAVGGSAGFLLGRRLASAVATDLPQQTLVVMGCTVVGIALAQLVSTRPAQRLHDRIEATRLRRLNAAGGAALTLAFSVLIVWMLATALALAPSTSLASLMRGSAVLMGLERTVPSDAGPLLQQLEVSSGLPASQRVFTGLGLIPTPEVPVPAADDVSPAARSTASVSVVRLLGHATCGLTLAGSGIVVADDLVLTNAHVIAGVASPVVFAEGRRIGTPATPVFFDPGTDLALLRVPDLGLPAVRISAGAASGDLVAVAGYPGAGELQVKAARIRGPVTATGTDLYGQSEARREVLVIAGDVQPGDSGGALLSSSGDVVGVVFAASGGVGPTAYALSGSEAAAAIAALTTVGRVDTGTCVDDS